MTGHLWPSQCIGQIFDYDKRNGVEFREWGLGMPMDARLDRISDR